MRIARTGWSHSTILLAALATVIGTHILMVHLMNPSGLLLVIHPMFFMVTVGLTIAFLLSINGVKHAQES
jgi:hypothetical protein